MFGQKSCTSSLQIIFEWIGPKRTIGWECLFLWIHGVDVGENTKQHKLSWRRVIRCRCQVACTGWQCNITTLILIIDQQQRQKFWRFKGKHYHRHCCQCFSVVWFILIENRIFSNNHDPLSLKCLFKSYNAKHSPSLTFWIWPTSLSLSSFVR